MLKDLAPVIYLQITHFPLSAASKADFPAFQFVIQELSLLSSSIGEVRRPHLCEYSSFVFL